MRRFILILCCLIVSGCNSLVDEQVNAYNRLVEEIKSYEKSDISSDIPFNIEVYLEKIIEDEITYRVIIDAPKEKLNNIEAIAIHDQKTNSIYPTSGIFEEPLNLIHDVTSADNKNVKGLILAGYIDYREDVKSFDGIIKVLVKYEDSNNKSHKVYYEYQK